MKHADSKPPVLNDGDPVELSFELKDLTTILAALQRSLLQSLNGHKERRDTTVLSIPMERLTSTVGAISESVTNCMDQIIDMLEQRVIVDQSIVMSTLPSENGNKTTKITLDNVLFPWQQRLHELEHERARLYHDFQSAESTLQSKLHKIEETRNFLLSQETMCITSYQKGLLQNLILVYDEINRLQGRVYKSQEQIRCRFIENVGDSLRKFVQVTRERIEKFLKEVRVHVQAHVKYLQSLESHEQFNESVDSDCDLRSRSSLEAEKAKLHSALQSIISCKGHSSETQRQLAAVAKRIAAVESPTAFHLLTIELDGLMKSAPTAMITNPLLVRKYKILSRKLLDLLESLQRTFDQSNKKGGPAERYEPSDLELRLLHDRRTVKVLRSLTVRDRTIQFEEELKFLKRLAQDFQTCEKQWNFRQTEWTNCEEWIQLRQSLHHYREEIKVKSACLYRDVLLYGKRFEDVWSHTRQNLQTTWDVMKIECAKSVAHECFVLFTDVSTMTLHEHLNKG